MISTSPCSNTERGISLLELLVTLVIGTIVLTAGYLTVRNLRGSHEQSLHHLSVEYRFHAVRATVNLHFASLDYDRTAPLPRIHSRGKVSHYDGTTVRLSGAHAPLSTADAISFISLVPKEMHTIRSRLAEELLACPRWLLQAPLSRYRSLLAVTLDSSYEVQSTYQAHGRCSLLRPRSTGSIFTATPTAVALHFVQNIVPIDHIYTVYVDRHREFRLLNHVGSRILENQPIVPGIDGLRFTLTSRVPPAVRSEVIIDGRSFSWMTTAALDRSDPTIVALERP